MKYLLILFISAISISSIAQPYDPEKVNKKAVDLHERGVAKLQDGQTMEGIAYIKKALEIEPKFVDALLSLASAYGELKNYATSVEYFEKGRALDTAYFSYYNLPYSINLAGLGRFEDALKAVYRF